MNAEKSNFWLSRLDYIFILRPMLFFPGWSTMLAGYFIGTKRQWFPPFEQPANLTEIVLLISGLALLMGSTFILNQLNDIESDRRNRKLFIISDGSVTEKTAAT
jgi:4-hydroxybenzoate polyprenyltransferase